MKPGNAAERSSYDANKLNISEVAYSGKAFNSLRVLSPHLYCNHSAVLFIEYASVDAFFAFLSIIQVISGTTNINSLQAVDKLGSKAMLIIDCQFGTLNNSYNNKNVGSS